MFATKGPDAAGLKDVAREAEVSHGLVTHYFGTFSALIEAALEDMAQKMVQRILGRLAEIDDVGPDELIDVYFDVMAQPQQGRLLVWAILSGRAESTDFFARRLQGPKLVADAIEARLRDRFPDADVNRAEIDWMIVLVMSVGFGFGMGRGVMWDALGRAHTPEEQHAFRSWLAALVRDRVPFVLGEPRGSSVPI